MKKINPKFQNNSLLKMGAILILTFGFTFIGMAQSKISGTISNEKSEATPGVTVLLKGTSQGAVTDLSGSYEITTTLEGDYTLVISFVGYKKIEEPITIGKENIVKNFQMTLDMMGLDEVVVTGVVNQKSKLESSVSISTLQPKAIEQSAPRTTAEVFRAIPGIKAEASAGDGNTNFTVRGVPISAGGSRYLQLQEDGLPIMLYGDIAFGTQDQFLRIDQNINRIEAIRGGSAATTTSNGPAGIINFISKNGNVEGGSVGTSIGLGYNSYRTDFEYGSPIGNNTSFHVGGFFRQGEGARNANHIVNQGGQIKANLTKYFDKGFARVYYKMLNDRTAAYLPMPIQVTGTNANPNWTSVDGYDARTNDLQSPFFQQNFGLGPDGNYRSVDLTDGIHSVENSVGAQIELDLANGWTFSSNSRMSFRNGGFIAPFTAEVNTTENIVGPIMRNNGDTTAAGALLPYTLNRVANNSTFADTDNGLLQRIHLFDVELENFNNFMSDSRLSKSFGKFDVTVGLFKSYQNIEMAWLWNTYLMEVAADADLVNINTNGADITDDGLVAQGVPLWGDCCTGKYNTNYDVTAPSASVSVEATDNLNIDASVRYDNVNVGGTVTPSQQLSNVDINGNGVIDAPERSVSRVDNMNAKIVNYNYGYLSYSFGANYKITNESAVFGRFSQGYVGNGERATWHQGGPYLSNGAPKNSLQQAELGYKRNLSIGGLFFTAFYAKTEEEAGVEATTQRVLSNDYQSYGLELESNFRFNSLDLRTGLTYVNAEIVDNDGDVNIGNTPRRQPALSFSLIPSYNLESGHSLGFSFFGQTSTYAQDNNELVLPAYLIVNAFISAQLTEGLSFSVDANNLLNSIGITESEEGSITDNQVNYVRARSIAGRTLQASLRFKF